MKSINKNEVGSRINTIRLSCGDNLREFGERIANEMGLPIKDAPKDSIVSRWEKGVSLPAPDRLKIIAELGGTSVDELLYGKGTIYLNKLMAYIKDYCDKEGIEFDEKIAHSISNNRANYTNVITSDHTILTTVDPPKRFEDIDLDKVIDDYLYLVGAYTKEEKQYMKKISFDELIKKKHISGLSDKEKSLLDKLEKEKNTNPDGSRKATQKDIDNF